MPSTALGSFFSLSEDFIARAVPATDAVNSASTSEIKEDVARAPEPTTDKPHESMQPDLPSQRASIPSEAGTTCSTCGIGVASEAFQSVAEQRAHFRLDWHRCNMRRRLAGRPALTETEFERSAQEGGNDLSSISGSDSDSSEDDERRGSHTGAGPLQRSAEVVFASGEVVFKVWRALLAPDGRGAAAPDQAALVRGLRALRESSGEWVVILSRGGHFAAAVFNVRPARAAAGQGRHEAPPFEVLAHKTFHRYVVRAKAGGRQSAKDATGKSIKSAGSALRRHNEALLDRDIREVLHGWREALSRAALVFVHAPSANAAPLFGGEAPALQRSDPRVRSVPFTTRRPTFMEAKRVAAALLTVQPASLPQPVPKPQKAPSRAAPAALPVVAEQPGGDETTSAAEATLAVQDSPLHVAAKAGNAEKVWELLQSGEDATQPDARGRVPYLVAASKEVRDAFRRHVAAAGPDLAWEPAAAGVPSALTPEMEAQQAARQAEKRAKLRERERERKKRAAERKARGAEESAAAAEAEVSSALARAAAAATQDPSARAKAKVSRAEEEAQGKREQLAQAAEARMARLRLVSQQQQLWWLSGVKEGPDRWSAGRKGTLVKRCAQWALATSAVLLLLQRRY